MTSDQDLNAKVQKKLRWTALLELLTIFLPFSGGEAYWAMSDHNVNVFARVGFVMAVGFVGMWLLSLVIRNHKLKLTTEHIHMIESEVRAAKIRAMMGTSYSFDVKEAPSEGGSSSTPSTNL